MLENYTRAFRTALKQIKRSGWLALASVAVMTLAFFISSVFTILAYGSNLFLESVEREPQIYAFFEIGTSEENIRELQEEWESMPEVAYIEYTSEEQARDEFYEAQRDMNELAAEAVQDRSLPASLAVRVFDLNSADRVNDKIIQTKEDRSEISTVLYSKEIVDNIREIFSLVRIGGGTVMLLLLIVLVLFTLLTIAFRMHSRAEEIGIMQLVGGNLFFIRLPFVIEGSIYGIIGAFISNAIMAILLGLLQQQLQNNELEYLQELLVRIDWPEVSIPMVVLIFSGTLVSGAILGALNSYVAIHRYIK
ncbi:MAG: cell division protein FtsX [Candidatus Dojkabacteria bacterium]